jgi:geranyl-CoA carboxylase beta subunit
MQEIAALNKLPLIYLAESGGANLMYQAEIFVDGWAQLCQSGTTFCGGHSADCRGAWLIDGGRCLPARPVGLHDTGARAFVDLSRRPAAGQGGHGRGWWTTKRWAVRKHTLPSLGLGEYLCENDEHAIAMAREVMDKLRWTAVSPAPTCGKPPRYDVEELMGVVPASDTEPYDARELIARLVDDSDFLEFKAAYATDTLCGHARIDGHLVGILANNGPIQPTGSVKAAQFIQLCDQSQTPLVFLQNTTGYMVGSQAERAGAIKHGSKMIQAVANARVPKLTIVVGGSFGAGNYGMCGRGFDPRFIFTWPSARTAVMGAAQAAKVMEIVSRAKLEKAGAPVNEDGLKAMSEGLRLRLEKESTVLYGTARLWDDGIIDPRDTRRVLSLCLAICAEADARQLQPNAFGVARM